MASKLGFHIQRRRPGWPDVVAETVPAVVKSLEWSIVDDWLPDAQGDALKREQARRWNAHNVFLLGRYPTFSQSLDRPEDRAYEFWQRLLDGLTGGDRSRRPWALERMRAFHAWEGYNEIGTGPDIERLGRFDAFLARRFHEEGMRYACGGFSMTKPELDEWPRYYESLLDAADGSHGDRPDFLHLHEYWFPPDPESLRESDELGLLSGEIDAQAMREATRGYMLHWRELYETPGTPWEIKLPVIISEAGWDRGWPAQEGYRRSGFDDDVYLRWLQWYDDELRRPLDGIDYVVGAALYTYGHEARWASFEIDDCHGRGILTDLRRYLSNENAEPHDWAWRRAWEDEPPPSPEQPPRPEGASHYVLLAQEVTNEWRHALSDYLQCFRATSGQSLDDALRCGADVHHITLVGDPEAPWGVPAELEHEIRKRRPDVLIDRLPACSVEELSREASSRVHHNARYGLGMATPR